MDGSPVTVVVLGQKGVGKTSFIDHCFTTPPGASIQHRVGETRVSHYSDVSICGKEIKIRIVESPGRHELIPALMVILMFDLTQQESFEGLQRLLEVAQRVSPVALRAVVGAKSDLQDSREVSIEKALAFCLNHSGSSVPIPYYETTAKFSDSIALAFQEIMARPLINDYVIKTSTEKEQKLFVYEVMEWAISSSSANIITHLREMGYSIPVNIIEEYPMVVRDYLLGEYPLREISRFKHLELKELNDCLSWEDSIMMDDCEDNILTIQDTRPTIHVSRTYHLLWRDISLSLFLPQFLEDDGIDIWHLTHVDLSHNTLPSIPPRFFQLPLLESLDLSHNRLTHLPPVEVWLQESSLQFLKVSHNLLGSDERGGVPGRRGICPALWHLDLRNNQFQHFPYFVLNFLSLRHLDLSNNGMITQIPPELSKMEQLVTLLLEDLPLIDPPSFVVEEGPKAILNYLKLKLSNKLLWSSWRVVVIGHYRAGKTSLISKITGGCMPDTNKGLDVVEWKYRGSEIFSFRSRWLTFDLWDFSGKPDLEFMYASFGCEKSLHLVVCSAVSGVHELVRKLADIQSLSTERLMVLVVFTHMDVFRSREDKEKFKKTHLQWLSYHTKQGGNGSFGLMATTSVRSLQGDEMLASYDAGDPMLDTIDSGEPKGPDIPLMPLVLRVHFVSCSTGEGIPSLRKTIYKVCSGGPTPQLGAFPRSTLTIREAPFLYFQVESQLRQLRSSHHDNQESQQQVLYTVEELAEQMKAFLEKMRVSDFSFRAAINFIHQMGLISVHQCGGGQALVCLSPQLIGCLLQQMVKGCQVQQETDPGAVFLANSHLAMMWGVEPIIALDTDPQEDTPPDTPPSVTAAQLLETLQHFKILSPLLPGTMFLSPALPHALPRSCDPDSTSLTPRRSYVFSYLPSSFHTHLITRIVGAVVRHYSPSTSPSSPNQPAPPASIPIHLPTGVELYLWQRNIFVNIPQESARVWVRIREVDVGLDPLPYCGRIDIHLSCPTLRDEACWLRLVTVEIDLLLEKVYPGLLDSTRPQKVEVFVPVSNKTVPAQAMPQAASQVPGARSLEAGALSEEPLEAEPQKAGPSGAELLKAGPSGVESLEADTDVFVEPSQDEATPSQSETTPPQERTTSPPQSVIVPSTNGATPPNNDPSCENTPPSVLGENDTPSPSPTRRKENSSSSSGQIADHFRKMSSPVETTPTSGRSALLSDYSWEVVSKYSTTSNRLSILQDQSDPNYDLVPLWECLQEAFKTPVIRVDSTRLTLSHMIPDLLFADLPPELLIRTKISPPEHYLMSLEDRFFGGVAPPPPEATGMFVQPYYSFTHTDIFLRKPAGALRAFYLQSCLADLRKDMLTLQTLRTAHLVAPVGLQYCPPSLGLEAAPFGTLSSWMRRLRRKINRVDTHHISLQLLKALEFFHSHNTSYHSINSDNILVWNLVPLVVKLSHSGITHSAKECELCVYLKSLPAHHSILQTYRFDYMLLGLLVYEMATGKRAFTDIYPLTTVVLALLHSKVTLNIEADHFLQKHSPQVRDGEDCIATGCQRLCLQSSVDQCLREDLVSHRELEARFSLCAGDHLWSPMRLMVNVETMVSSGSDQVYWASGSRGLVTGSIVPSTGDLQYNLLQEAPPPESGLFANRRMKPVPIAVGRASGVALVQETNQVWVGTENGQMGAVYVFKLPDMRRHHHVHLQDAVLSLCAVNRLRGTGEEEEKEMKYRVVVGMANGTIILYKGMRDKKVLENPLLGPKIVVATHQRKPCLSMMLSPEGQLWCACGDIMEVYNIYTLKLTRQLRTSLAPGAPGSRSRGAGITLMAVSGKGVCTVGRRSPIVSWWDQKTGHHKSSYDVSEVVHGTDPDITSLAVKNRALWLGTRNGYLLILDSYLMEEGKDPLLGLQHCGCGKVKCIVPLNPLPSATSKLQVMCSLEFADEISCHLLSWEYFYMPGNKGSTPLDHTPKISATVPDLVVTSHSHSELPHCKSF